MTDVKKEVDTYKGKIKEELERLQFGCEHCIASVWKTVMFYVNEGIIDEASALKLMKMRRFDVKRLKVTSQFTEALKQRKEAEEKAKAEGAKQ